METIQKSIKVKKDLYNKIKVLADNENRSFSNFIETMFIKYLGQDLAENEYKRPDESSVFFNKETMQTLREVKEGKVNKIENLDLFLESLLSDE